MSTDNPSAVNRVPIVQSFLITGLHGYKDVSFEFNNAVKIVIAENGAGKTTILSALEAFLRRDFAKLARIPFETIECRLAGVSKTLLLKRASLPGLQESQKLDQLADLAKYAEVDVGELEQAILESVPVGGPARLHQHHLFHRIYASSPFSEDETEERLLAVRDALEQALPPEVQELGKVLQEIFEPYEIVYLPTYRRIERPLARSDSGHNHPRYRRVPGRMRPPSRSTRWAGSDINYGLADVNERLAELMEDIQRRSNIGYRQISATIIDDLLAGKLTYGQVGTEKMPEIEDLRLFFSRLEQASKVSDDRLNAVMKLYESEDIKSSSQAPLRFFLGKLATVVGQTKGLEADIEAFVKKANVYLKTSSDEKMLNYNAARMKVLVKNLWTEEEVKLDELSSGEKQVISLFANLYLYKKQKIVLIDEPELSLSMEWQQRLLPDIANSPRCAQLLAITHSPFIFDNELDPFAGPIKIERRKKGQG